MKVLHVISSAQRRGAEMFASDLIPQLHEAGVTQRVAVLRGPTLDGSFYSVPTRELSNGRSRIVPGLKVDANALRTLARIRRSWGPDVIQVHGGEPLKYAALTSGAIPIVYRRIGLSPTRARSGATNRSYRILLRRCRRIVAVAEAVRMETIDVFGVAADRVTTIPRGVDARRIRSTSGRARARTRLGIPPEAPVVLSLGALSPEKDPLAHLDVMDRVRRAVPDPILLIAGDGPLRNDVEQRIVDAGLDDSVRVLGSRSDVADLLAAADVLLLASRSEGMPGCLIEAGMAGLAVVAYDVAGVPEVVTSGQTGYTVPSGNVAALAERTISLLRDPSLRARMGEAARERCERSYEISKIAPRYLSIYEEVLG